MSSNGGGDLSCNYEGEFPDDLCCFLNIFALGALKPWLNSEQDSYFYYDNNEE